MKIMTILGTRPEIIRLSLIIKKLDNLVDHILVHTGQNYDKTLSENVFKDLGVREPDHFLGVKGATAGEQIGQILIRCEDIFSREKPDRLLILGDTNSGLAAMIAKRFAIPVFHMEAGNRCYDDRVPEETNRRIIDHSSDVLMPYTERSRANLLREGIPGERIFVTGNPILEVIREFDGPIAASTALSTLGVEANAYFLVSMHRSENVDQPKRLEAMIEALDRLGKTYKMPVLVSTHPRTRSRMDAASHRAGDRVRFLDPFGFFDFVALEKNALCVLSDSGTVQEECALFGVPNVTLRDVTERPETIECGSNYVSGVEVDSVLQAVRIVLASKAAWTPPPEYLAATVSNTVVRIVTSYHHHLPVKAGGGL